MKIIHYVLSDRYAGIEQHVNELAVEQSKSNEVLIITNAKIKKYFDKNLKIISSHNYSRRSFSSIFFLLKTIKDEKPNIVHNYGSKTTHLINRIKYFLSFNHVATIHGIKSKIKVYLKPMLLLGLAKQLKIYLIIKLILLKIGITLYLRMKIFLIAIKIIF